MQIIGIGSNKAKKILEARSKHPLSLEDAVSILAGPYLSREIIVELFTFASPSQKSVSGTPPQASGEQRRRGTGSKDPLGTPLAKARGQRDARMPDTGRERHEMRSQAASFGSRRERKSDKPISPGGSSCLTRADIENWLQGTNVNNNLEENRVVPRSHEKQKDNSSYQGLPRPPNTRLNQGKKERERDIPSGTNRPGSRQHNMRIRQADESRPSGDPKNVHGLVLNSHEGERRGPTNPEGAIGPIQTDPSHPVNPFQRDQFPPAGEHGLAPGRPWGGPHPWANRQVAEQFWEDCSERRAYHSSVGNGVQDPGLPGINHFRPVVQNLPKSMPGSRPGSRPEGMNERNRCDDRTQGATEDPRAPMGPGHQQPAPPTPNGEPEIGRTRQTSEYRTQNEGDWPQYYWDRDRPPPPVGYPNSLLRPGGQEVPGSPVDREVKITEETRGKGRTRQHSSSRGRRRSRPGGYDERRGRQWDTSLSGSGSLSDEESGSSQTDASVKEVHKTRSSRNIPGGEDRIGSLSSETN